jgi:hypothetical protein
MRRASDRLFTGIKGAIDAKSGLTRTETGSLSDPRPEPPVVARLMIEIRSDGSRTIARGALEDIVNDKNVALQAEGRTPAELARSLTAMLLGLPLFASQIAKSLKAQSRKSNGER